MFSLFMPDWVYNDIYEITPEVLTSQGIRALILDIDNTLVTYDDPKPTERVANWLEAMKNAGIAVAFVSNNHAPRVSVFCDGLGYYSHADAKKPSRRYLYEAMSHMNSDTTNTASIGDQVFTGIWAAERCGMRAFLVSPIKDKKTPFFRFKRLLERPVLYEYRRRAAKMINK